MSVPNWPTLSRQPKSVKGQKVDNTIRTPLADGRLFAMARSTTQRWQFDLTYHGMTDVDHTTLSAFEDARGIGAGVFQWIHPKLATTHYCQLARPIEYVLDEETQTWRFECHFVEPGGTYS